MSVQRTIDVQLTPEEIGREFADMSGDDQARFIVAAVKEMATWGHFKAEAQAVLIGSELATHDEKTATAIEVVALGIAEGMRP